MLGIDVYQRYDTITDWQQIKADGVGACWVKLTDGSGPANTPGDTDVHNAQGVGIPVGGYHFAEAFPQPENQATVFAAELTRLNALDIAPMLDLEGSIPNPEEFRARFWQHFNQIKPLAHYLTYASESWWSDGQLTDSPVTPGELIWVARYGTNTGTDQGTALSDWDVHQFTSQGVLAGAKGFLDLDNVKSDVFLRTVPTPVPPAPPAPPPGTEYTVESGDTLSAIAARYGVTWEAIYAANRAVIGPDPNRIFPGQRLTIPHGGAAPGATVYTVQHGDTLSAIAARYGVTWEAIYAANRAVIGPNPNRIFPDQRLTIPT